MADQWYYSNDGEQHGPFTPAQLKQLAASGQIAPSHLVWKEGMSDWKPARSVKGLFPEAAVPPPPPVSATPPEHLAARTPAQERRWYHDPILIGVLSFLLPPLGQFIIGQRIKAIVIFLLAPVAYGVLAFIDWNILGGATLFIRWYLLPPAYGLLVASDAYLLCKRLRDGETVNEWDFGWTPAILKSNQSARPAIAEAQAAEPVKPVEPKPSGFIPSLVAMTAATVIAFVFGIWGFLELGPSGLHDMTGLFVCISIGYNGLVTVMLWVTAAQKKHSMLVTANRLVFGNWVFFFLTRVPMGLPVMGCMLSGAAAVWGHFVLQREDVKSYLRDSSS